LVLYIYTTDAFYAASELTTYRHPGATEARMRTMLAGSVMTSVANAFLVLALGWEPVVRAVI
jgi:hypothetical protein